MYMYMFKLFLHVNSFFQKQNKTFPLIFTGTSVLINFSINGAVYLFFAIKMHFSYTQEMCNSVSTCKYARKYFLNSSKKNNISTAIKMVISARGNFIVIIVILFCLSCWRYGPQWPVPKSTLWASLLFIISSRLFEVQSGRYSYDYNSFFFSATSVHYSSVINLKYTTYFDHSSWKIVPVMNSTWHSKREKPKKIRLE